jgi:uncharacterized protein (TIGR03083 family)
MMNRRPVAIGTVKRIGPGAQADALATNAYSALLADLATLTDDDWAKPTDCVGWNVRDMTAHLVGAAEGHARVRVFLGQYAWGVRHRKAYSGSALDAMNQKQIDSKKRLADASLPGLLADLAPRAVAGRSRLARLLGWAPISLDAAGSWYEGMPTRTTMGELCAVVLTRDVWAHRLDLARAVGSKPTIDPLVDGSIVADIVADWSHRHGQPFTLHLTGDAGGAFTDGQGGESLTLDALDFARLMAGRRPDSPVPDSPLWATKVLF